MSLRLPLILLSGALALSLVSAAQADRFAWAITDIHPDGANWSYLRKIDLQKGTFSEVVLDGYKSTGFFDAATKQPVSDAAASRNMINSNTVFGNGVAALAYDDHNNRLWFTPMYIDQLRYIDLKTMKVFAVTAQGFTGMAEKNSDQANIVTRMVIASDRNGYALTNDGNHLLRFTTGKNISVTDLGTLVDAPSNNGISIHNSCSSFGGDVVADDNGNLLIFSAAKHVFSIDPSSKVATHLGFIKGLPDNFSVNGAAVNDKNQIILTSAVVASAGYTVDLRSLQATAVPFSGEAWKSSDLANSNVLQTKSSAGNSAAELVRNDLSPANDLIQVYPNPVTSNQFMLQFKQVTAGNYTLVITDVMGRQVIQKAFSISNENQRTQVSLPAANAKGIYLVKVTDENGVARFSQKLIVQ